MAAVIEIVQAGMSSTIQDQGRPGWAHLGIAPSGAVDPALAAMVNRLVGNPETAPVIETVGGLTLRAHGPTVMASSAAIGPQTLRAGEGYTVDPHPDRVWQYVALRGGVIVEPVLGSCATDTMAELGPAPLRPGDRLRLGPDPQTLVISDFGVTAPLGHTVRVWPGPRADWFDPRWASALIRGPITVQSLSRVGVRLDAPPMARTQHGELPSEGLIRGAIQVPPSGELVMMLADYPTTGGYPVLAVVHPDDVAIVAQHRPGTRLHFQLI